MATTSSRSPNRLGKETSPYLRQHANNPVDWYPWGEEAFERARREDKPVFLSIGYSSCHWCHVMEHESFENDETAAFLNEHFVSIKVDREERPDVDDVYMTAVQLTTGHGGWPLSAFLLPDKRPFFTGTYFPPDDRHGRPGFRTVLERLADAYRQRRDELQEAAQRIAEEIADSSRMTGKKAGPLDAERLGGLTKALARSFDAEHGGFGGAPKFPPHMALEWLLTRGAGGDLEALRMATATLDAMAFGGLHDHLAGGFHRYATDAQWLLPHFEKMLTDNALLLCLYGRAWAVTGRDLYRRTALGVGDYLLREMRGPEGGFYAATDADSEGEEGKYFVWAEVEVREVLGREDAAFFGAHYRVRTEGNYRDEATGRATGLNILHLLREPSPDDEKRLALLRPRLLKHRLTRVAPALDDKRISGWNALTVSGLAVAGKALSEERYLDAARSAARFLLNAMRDGEGRLLRTWKDGEGKIPAFLEDEAFLANALLDLAEAEQGDLAEQAVRRAHEVVDRLRRRFHRPGQPGFTFAGEGHEELLTKGRDLFDKAIPSGSASATRALTRLALRTGDAELASEARAALEEVAWLMSRSPHGTETWHLALEELLEFEKRFGRTRGQRKEPPGALATETDAVHVEALAAAPSVRAGEKFEVALTIQIRDGFHLLGEDGLAVEAWAGTGLTVQPVTLPPPQLVKNGEGHDELHRLGNLRLQLVVAVSERAVPGEWIVAVNVKFRACGEGTCRPLQVVSLGVPVDVVP